MPMDPGDLPARITRSQWRDASIQTRRVKNSIPLSSPGMRSGRAPGIGMMYPAITLTTITGYSSVMGTGTAQLYYDDTPTNFGTMTQDNDADGTGANHVDVYNWYTASVPASTRIWVVVAHAKYWLLTADC